MTNKAFNYNSLSPDVRAFLEGRTARLKTLIQKNAETAIKIGQELIDVKDALPHGQFLDWLRAEFDWSERTARNYMAVARRFPITENFSDLNVSLSVLQLLARPSTSDEAVEYVINSANENGGISYTSAADLVKQIDQPDIYETDRYMHPPAYEQTIIFPTDDQPQPEYIEYESALPVLRFDGERTTTTTTTTTHTVEKISFDLPGDRIKQLPLHLQSIVRIDPIMDGINPPRIAKAIEHLMELYQHVTGHPYGAANGLS